jgi:hypothetical protein
MSYLQAKARNPVKGMEDAIAVITLWGDGEFRTHLLREGGMPFCSSAPATVEAAKLRCQQTMGIQPDEWETHDGEPVWLPILFGAWKATISKISSDGDDGEGG